MISRVGQIVDVWRDAGFKADSYTDINKLIWEKFICNVAFSGPCTVFKEPIRGVMANPDAWKIARQCAVEAYAAGCARQIDFSFDDPEDYVTAFGNKLIEARPSMLLDHLARRHSEIDAINGMVPVVAAEVGTSAPYNEVVTAVIKAREAKFGDDES